MSGIWRSRWAAVGAAVAVTLGAGGLGIANATTSSGEKPIYQPIVPCRLADTRPAPDNVGGRTSPVGPEESYTLTGWGTIGNCTLPSGTAGLALNVTAVAPTLETYLTLYPTGASLPLTSNLNPTPGQPPTPNAVEVDLNGSGQFDVFNKYGFVNVVVDVVGYYDDHTHDDRYYTESESDSMAARVGYATGNANFEPGFDVVEDVATLTIEAPTGATAITVVTATVHVFSSGDQQSEWTLDIARVGGASYTAMVRRMSVLLPDPALANPSDTITLSTALAQNPGAIDVVTVSGTRTSGVPLANIQVEISSVSAPLDSTGTPASPLTP